MFTNYLSAFQMLVEDRRGLFTKEENFSTLKLKKKPLRQYKVRKGKNEHLLH